MRSKPSPPFSSRPSSERRESRRRGGFVPDYRNYPPQNGSLSRYPQPAIPIQPKCVTLVHMHSRKVVPPDLRVLAHTQDGVLTTAQALASGLSRRALDRLVAGDTWRHLDHGLYLIHAGEPTWRSWVWGGLALAGDGAYTTGLTAGALHDLHPARELPIHVAIPDRRHLTSRDWLKIHRPRTAYPSLATTSGPARPRVVDAVLDLCSESQPRDVADWLFQAIGGRRTTPARLLDELERRTRIGNRALILAILSDLLIGVNSHLERQYFYRVERPHGLPVATRQFRIPETGRYADGGYEQYRLLIELDGEHWHSGRQQFRDRKRDNRHALADWRSLRFGWPDIMGEPCEVAHDVVGMLRVGGWKGEFRSCFRCS